MGRLTHMYEPGMTYLITTITYRRQRLFVDAACLQAAHEDIRFYAGKFGVASLAHVVMPDHVHWVIYPSSDDFERFARQEQEKSGKYAGAPERFYLSKIMEDYKRHTAFEVNRLRGIRGAQVWQDGFRDDGLRTPQSIRRAVQYVVMNPVKAGLVERLEDYPYLAWDARRHRDAAAT
jgi:putative transposase